MAAFEVSPSKSARRPSQAVIDMEKDGNSCMAMSIRWLLAFALTVNTFLMAYAILKTDDLMLISLCSAGLVITLGTNVISIVLLSASVDALLHAIDAVTQLHIEEAIILTDPSRLNSSELRDVIRAFNICCESLLQYKSFIPDAVKEYAKNDYESDDDCTQGSVINPLNVDARNRTDIHELGLDDEITTMSLTDFPLQNNLTIHSTGTDASAFSQATATAKRRRPAPVLHRVVQAGRTNESLSTSVCTTASLGAAQREAVKGKDDRLRKQLSKLEAFSFKQKAATMIIIDLHQSSESILQPWFTAVAETIKKYHGIYLQTTATSFIATWNAHRTHHQHAMEACKCALEIKSTLITIAPRESWSVAVTTGNVRVGYVGTDNMRVSSVFGDAITSLPMLSQLSRRIGCRVIITEDTYNSVRDQMFARPIDTISFPISEKSKMRDIHTVYELISPIGCSGTKFNNYDLYLDGVSAFRKSLWGESQGKLTTYLLTNAGDKQALRLLRVATHQRNTDSEEILGSGDDEEGYIRSFIGWDNIESRTHDNDLPDGVLQRAGSVSDTIALDVQDLTLLNDKKPDGGLLMCKIREVENLGVGMRVESDEVGNALVDTNGVSWLLLTRVLGSGAYGKVRLGMSSTGALVAVKTMVVRLEKCQEIVEEVAVMENLRHDNVVSYLSSGLSSRTAFVVMEWICGGSLKDVLKSFGGPLPVSMVRRYSLDILRGLAYLHHRNIIHRDLKPHNVLLTAEGVCKLADFGASAKLTSTVKKMEIVGTPMYMSPEGCRGCTVRVSDVWSFGITACQLATFELPYVSTVGSKLRVFMQSLGYGNFSPVIPGTLKDQSAINFINKCFTRDPELRPTAQSLLTDPFLM